MQTVNTLLEDELTFASAEDAWQTADVPDLDELLASFSELDPRSESFSLPEYSTEENWFAEAPGSDIFSFDDSYEDIEYTMESFFPPRDDELADDPFPEPEEISSYSSAANAQSNKKRRSPLRLATVILFGLLCIGLVVSAMIFAFGSERPVFSRPSYYIQSPTMTPGPGDALASLREGNG